MNSEVTANQRPSYPSSKQTRDWDKIEAQVKKEVCKCVNYLYFSGANLAPNIFISGER